MHAQRVHAFTRVPACGGRSKADQRDGGPLRYNSFSDCNSDVLSEGGLGMEEPPRTWPACLWCMHIYMIIDHVCAW